MIDFVRALKSHAAYGQRVCALLAALLVAEFFFKFHSFTLECMAFLATWLLLDCLAEQLMGKPGDIADRDRRAKLGRFR